MERQTSTGKKYYCPELKAKEIQKFLTENPEYQWKGKKYQELIKMFADKFQRTERTIQTYLYMARREIKKNRPARIQKIIDRYRKYDSN